MLTALHPRKAWSAFCWRRALEALASPRWMVAFFLLAALCALSITYGLAEPTAAMLPPLGLLALNLSAAIAIRPVFRRDAPLLLFHVALLALVLLFGLGRLTYRDAAVALSNGTEFDGQLVRDDHGPWHTDRLSELRFANEGFTENYPRRGRHVATYNRVSWWDSEGAIHVAEIGDDHPLLLGGYRIYSTRQRGFSPVFQWQGNDGAQDTGTVQLSDQTSGSFAPANAWTLPDGRQAWTMLELAEPRQPIPGTRQPDLAADVLAHRLILRIDGKRHALRPGESLQLPAGRLTYLRLDSWMSYRIVYDPSRPWLVATVLVAIVSLAALYLRRFRGRRLAA
jgi:hypothetical protein